MYVWVGKSDVKVVSTSKLQNRLRKSMAISLRVAMTMMIMVSLPMAQE